MNDITAPGEAKPTEAPAGVVPDTLEQTADAPERSAESPAQPAASPVTTPEPPASHTQPMPPTPFAAPTEPLPHAAPPETYPTHGAYPTQAAYPAPPHAAPQPWPGQQVAPAYPPYPPVSYTPSPYGAPKSSRPGLVLAVISLIVSGIALLAVFGMAVFMFGPAGPAGPGGMMEPLTGKVPSVLPSTSLLGDRLSSEVSVRMEDDGWIVDEVKCPTTPKVAQGVVTVCHATTDDGEWAVVVYFEDDQGTYTLNAF